MRLDRARATANFIKRIQSLVDNWDFYNQGNGWNSMILWTDQGSKRMTKADLIKLLEFNRKHLREMLDE